MMDAGNALLSSMALQKPLGRLPASDVNLVMMDAGIALVFDGFTKAWGWHPAPDVNLVMMDAGNALVFDGFTKALSREPFFLRMAIWRRGLEPWYLVLGGDAVGRGFELQSDLELSFPEILMITTVVWSTL
jgi:hypothetical protein